MAIKTVIYALVFIYSLLLINAGITGYVVSESCCFGDECPEEYLCPTNMEEPSTNTRFLNLGLGIFLMMTSLFMMHMHINKN